MNYLSEFQADGRTIVMVTHDAFVAGFAKRVLRLVAGKVNEVAPKVRAA
jgi:ABC-type lipoprotein export system ATPase subunit